MKFSEAWLRQWVNPSLDSDELLFQLTMAGLEVDGTEPAAQTFSGVVVGEIVSAEQHPDADKLRVCDVSDGNERFQVVCGAPNARAGLKTAFAKVGAVLPDNFKIKKAKLRGWNLSACSAALKSWVWAKMPMASWSLTMRLGQTLPRSLALTYPWMI